MFHKIIEPQVLYSCQPITVPRVPLQGGFSYRKKKRQLATTAFLIHSELMGEFNNFSIRENNIS